MQTRGSWGRSSRGGKYVRGEIDERVNYDGVLLDFITISVLLFAASSYTSGCRWTLAYLPIAYKVFLEAKFALALCDTEDSNSLSILLYTLFAYFYAWGGGELNSIYSSLLLRECLHHQFLAGPLHSCSIRSLA